LVTAVLWLLIALQGTPPDVTARGSQNCVSRPVLLVPTPSSYV